MNVKLNGCYKPICTNSLNNDHFSRIGQLQPSQWLDYGLEMRVEATELF